jgi:phosphate:Na+ symporter
MGMLAPFVAGLGLYFCGIRFLSLNLTPLAGRRFRLALTKLLNFRAASSFAGIFGGIVTQSVDAVTFVIIGLVSTGTVNKRRAILIPTWAHVGTAVLVVLVALNFAVAASYLVAVAGFALYFGLDRTDQSRHIFGTLLGIGLLFLGLETLKAGAVPIREMLMGGGLIATLADHPAALLALGFGLTIVCQSSVVTSTIAVAATAAGLFDLDGAIWLVLGANLGSGFNYIVLSRTLRGEASQLVLMQTLQKVFGFLVVGGILLAEVITSRALLEPGAAIFAQSASGKLAAIALFHQIAGSLICTLLLGPIMRVLEWLLPPSELQEMSKPVYLIEEALVEPTFAIELVEREKNRLLARLPVMLDEVRADAAVPSVPTQTIRTAADAIHRAMTDYLEQVGNADLDRADRERVVRLQHRVANLNALFDGVADFVKMAKGARIWPSSAQVADQMVEALHALLTSLAEATESGDPADREILLALLGHRDEMMDRMRRRVLREDPDMPPKAQEALFSTTMLFERIVWLARRNALLLTSETPAIEAEAAETKAAA